MEPTPFGVFTRSLWSVCESVRGAAQHAAKKRGGRTSSAAKSKSLFVLGMVYGKAAEADHALPVRCTGTNLAAGHNTRILKQNAVPVIWHSGIENVSFSDNLE
jgi:hypothetical protein